MLTYTAIKDFPGLFIAAAGNNGANTDYNKFYPAGFATDITVSGATMSGYTRVYSGSVTIP